LRHKLIDHYGGVNSAREQDGNMWGLVQSS
jgi:hypothetical protein